MRRSTRGLILLVLGAILILTPTSIAVFGYTSDILIASEQAASPFDKTLIFIDHHNIGGAVGVILNKPLTDEQRAHLPRYVRDAGIPVGYGGPLEPDHIIIIKDAPAKLIGKGQAFEADDWDDEVKVTPDLLDKIREDYKNHGNKYRVFAGLVSWDSFQLEKQVFIDNAWIAIAPDHDVMFQTGPDAAWDAVYKAEKARQQDKSAPKPVPNQT